MLLAAHAQTLVAADFFSVDTIFLKRLYVLIYVHLASRRVLLASCTYESDAASVTQQARNLSSKLEDEGIKLSVLIHHRDKKFAHEADRVFQSQGARVILTPLMAPKANAHAEHWIESCRRECLDRMLVVDQCHLKTVIREYCLHYNEERPHRSRNPRPLGPQRPFPDCRWPDRVEHPPWRLSQRPSLCADGCVTSLLNSTGRVLSFHRLGVLRAARTPGLESAPY